MPQDSGTFRNAKKVSAHMKPNEGRRITRVTTGQGIDGRSLGLGEADLHKLGYLFDGHRTPDVWAQDAVDRLMRRACETLASEFGLLARRIK
jgi:hypothetical protein